MAKKLVQYVGRHHVGFLALLFAMSGTAYAASLPRNSVGTSQLRSNAVTSSKVKDRSLRAVDFARGQLPAGARGATGPQGAQGPAGPQGPGGPQGPAGGSLTYVVDGPFTNPAHSQSAGSATCPPGQHPTGGGVVSESITPGEQAVNSTSPFASSTVPGAEPDSWGAFVDNTSASDLLFEVFAVCAPAGQVTSNFTAKGALLKKQ